MNTNEYKGLQGRKSSEVPSGQTNNSNSDFSPTAQCQVDDAYIFKAFTRPLCKWRVFVYFILQGLE